MQTVASLLQLHEECHGCLAVLLAHCRQFEAEQLTREFDGFGFPSLLAQLRHLIGCEDFWLSKLQDPSGQVPPRVKVEGELLDTIDQLDGLRQRIAAATVAYIRHTGDAALNQPLTLRWPEEGPAASEERTPAFIVLHFITHAFHHKGQAVALCRLLGKPAPDTDIQRAAE